MKEMALTFGEMVYEYPVIVRGVNNKLGKDFKTRFPLYIEITKNRSSFRMNI